MGHPENSVIMKLIDQGGSPSTEMSSRQKVEPPFTTSKVLQVQERTHKPINLRKTLCGMGGRTFSAPQRPHQILIIKKYRLERTCGDNRLLFLKGNTCTTIKLIFTIL